MSHFVEIYFASHRRLTHVSASVGPNPTVRRFRNELPDYEDVRRAFKAYSKRELPGKIKLWVDNMFGTDQS